MSLGWNNSSLELIRFSEKLATKVAQHGGDLALVLARMSENEDEYVEEFDALAKVLASVYYTDQGLPCPEGGRIFTLTVPVDESRDFREAVIATARSNFHHRGNPPDDDWVFEHLLDREIKEDLALFPADTCAKLRDTRVILVNFGKEGLSRMERWGKDGVEREVMPWAKEHHLLPASPRTVLAVGEHVPELREMVGCFLRVETPSSYREGAGKSLLEVAFTSNEPRIHRNWIYNATPTFYEDNWFAFVRED